MKKTYFNPEMDVIELKTVTAILAGSDGLDNIDSGGSDGTMGGSDKPASDTSQDGWDVGF